MPQNINLEQVPKRFCERIVVGANNQYFILMPIVGTSGTAFAITPEHAKHLAKLLTREVEKFEKDFRAIPDVTAAVPSPIRRSDLPPTEQQS